MCLLVIVAAAAGVILPAPIGARAQPPPAVGVVSFYAPSPLETFDGIDPKRFAADELSAMLAQASAGRLTVIPRPVIEQAEAHLGWQETDVLRFERLQALGRAVNADQLIVGWIPLLVVEVGNGTGTMPPDGGGPPTATANLVEQVFSVAQGRIVTEMHTSGFALGAIPVVLTQWVLQRAVQPAVAPLISAVTSAH
jgi:hypothetical protein